MCWTHVLDTYEAVCKADNCTLRAFLPLLHNAVIISTLVQQCIHTQTQLLQLNAVCKLIVACLQACCRKPKSRDHDHA